ncbi:MAG: hypothetical protein IKJ02_06160 [Tidjanibacter sp.]|nr:hypothetical protein [Tidjanibacter sp.]
MKKIFLMMAAVVAFASVSCESDNLNPDTDKKFVKELTVNIVNESSKVTFTENSSGLSFGWEDGDKIYAYLYEVNAKDRVDEFTYDAETDKFVAEGAGLEVGKTYYVVRGSVSTVFNFNDGNISANFSLESGHILTDLPMMSDKFVASAEGTIADLHHLVSIVLVPVLGAGETIYRPRLNVANSTGDKVIRGLFNVEFDGENIKYRRWAPGGDLAFTEAMGFSSWSASKELHPSNRAFFPFVVLPGEYDHIEFQAVLNTATEEVVKGGELSDKVIYPGKYYYLSSPLVWNN